MRHIDLTAHLNLPHGSLTTAAPQFSHLTSRIRSAQDESDLQDADHFTEGATRLFALFLLLFVTLIAAAVAAS